jgi:predicted dehydrogenase
VSGPDAARLGLVGCGRLVERGYLPALAAVDGLRLVAVADPDAARRALVADLAGPEVAGYDSTAALLDEVPVDVMILATPTATHVEDAAAAARAGVVSLVEKPPAPDATGAAALAALTPTPWVGFNRRFDPAARSVRDALVDAGPVDLDLAIHYRRSGWAAHQVRDDALLDLGPHLVDWSRWLTGAEALEVSCPDLGPERAEVDLTTSRGRVRLRMATDRPHLETIEARDGNGRVVARHRAGGLVAGVRGRLRPGPHPLVQSLTGQLQALAAGLSEAPDGDLGTAADGVAVMTVIDAARTSAAQDGRAVAVPVAPVPDTGPGRGPHPPR